MDSFCPSHRELFEELERIAPGVPLLALGQTPFWDEPMKAGVALCSQAQGYNRRFIAGIHDTDYFAKHPGEAQKGGYFALPHNDTTTRDLWSAAGEFSMLFGSETVVTRAQLSKAGAKLNRVSRERPGLLTEATEAWGWRGVVFAGDQAPTISETPLDQALTPLVQTLDWAIQGTIQLLPNCLAEKSRQKGEELRTLACNAATDDLTTVGQYYQALLPDMYRFVTSGRDVDIDTTCTTQLLRFAPDTCHMPRFTPVKWFLDPETNRTASDAYNEALSHAEAYSLDKFGSWAIPFDLVIPGIGRGTIRIAPRAVLIMTATPVAISTKKRVESLSELAELIANKFGNNCALVGKAVTLISMLAQEHIFVFHEGASSYMPLCRKFHKNLIATGISAQFFPILRVKYETWDCLKFCESWFRLPDVLQGPFGAPDISASSFSNRWETVVETQLKLLNELSSLRKPIDLIRFLSTNYSQSWEALLLRYEDSHAQLDRLHDDISKIKAEKAVQLSQWKLHKSEANQTAIKLGQHWREKLFSKDQDPEDLNQRHAYQLQYQIHQEDAKKALQNWKNLQAEQDKLARSDATLEAHKIRRDLELEIELARVNLVRQAVTASTGLKRAGFRPSAWWFPIVCPDGDWFEKTVNNSEYYLEHLT